MADRNPRRLIVIIIITILVVAAVGLAFYLGQSTSAPPTTTPTPTVSTPVIPNPRTCPPIGKAHPSPASKPARPSPATADRKQARQDCRSATPTTKPVL